MLKSYGLSVHRPDFLPPYGLYPTLCIKKKFFTKNPLNFCSLKVTQFHSDSVKNESSKTNAPPPWLFLLLSSNFSFNEDLHKILNDFRIGTCRFLIITTQDYLRNIRPVKYISVDLESYIYLYKLVIKDRMSIWIRKAIISR